MVCFLNKENYNENTKAYDGNYNENTPVNIGNPTWVEIGDSTSSPIYTAFREGIVDFVAPTVKYEYCEVVKPTPFEDGYLEFKFILEEKYPLAVFGSGSDEEDYKKLGATVEAVSFDKKWSRNIGIGYVIIKSQ